MDEEVTAAVLMDPGPGVEGRRRDRDGAPVGTATHDDLAAALGGTQLGPVEIRTISDDLAEGDGVAGDDLSRDRRFPGSVWRGRHRDHGRVEVLF